MKHLKAGKKFGRKKDKRKAFVKSLAANLILNEKIITTETRAKEIKKRAEKLITLGKKQNAGSLRLLMARLPKIAASKIFYKIAPRYKNKNGGYTRIVKTAKFRKRDGAKMAIIELV